MKSAFHKYLPQYLLSRVKKSMGTPQLKYLVPKPKRHNPAHNPYVSRDLHSVAASNKNN